MNFFAPAGTLTAAGVFRGSHYLYAFFTVSAVILSLFLTRNVSERGKRTVVMTMTAILAVIEAAKIIFVFATETSPNPNSYLPFYFCSIEIYAALLAVFAKGKLKRAGEVFIATGGIIGGVFFIVYPLTSLSIYPALHFISVQSFVFHGIMLFGGLFMLINAKLRLCLKDIFYYGAFVLSISAVALCINLSIGTNLMFLSQNYPGTFIEPIYNTLPTPVFTVLSALIQATLPFLAVYSIFDAVINLSRHK